MLVIIAGGEINNYQGLRQQILQADCIICADGGARHARTMGIIPNMIIGDMDSLAPNVLERFENQGVQIIRYPSEKDQVDTELAILQAIKLGYGDITLLGATGGRLDHTLANIHLLVKAAELGARVKIIDEYHCIYLVTTKLPAEIIGKPDKTLSLIPLTSEVKGVDSRGLKWELQNRTFTIGNPFGISNRLTADNADIKIKEGILLVIEIISEGGTAAAEY